MVLCGRQFLGNLDDIATNSWVGCYLKLTAHEFLEKIWLRKTVFSQDQG